MTSLLIPHAVTPLEVDLTSVAASLTDAQFYQLCKANPNLRIERTAKGQVIVMPPVFSDTGNRNFNIAVKLGVWAEKDATGLGFDSSAGFTLPNGATRSPDASWILLERWNALKPEEQASFAPICPDFVIELRSSSDSLKALKSKLEEYVQNGVKLGWLIDRKGKTAHIYRPGLQPAVLADPASLDASPELPGFRLEMARVW